MNKFRLFIENFIVYGFGGIISRVIPLIMLPIVTRIMPGTEYFGLYDLSNTVVQFAGALAVMGMYDAMYRLFFEKDDFEYKKTVCSTALCFTVLTSLLVFIILVLSRNFIATWFFNNKKYAYLVYLSATATLVGATNSIVSAPTRMENKRRIFLITNTISPIISYSISIPLLLKGFYVIALPLAGIIAGTSMEITFLILNHKWFDFHRFDKKVLKDLLIIAIPLLPNFLIYWVFNSCDKLMITNLIGLGAAGIYSVGSKLGHASQLIYTAFAGGWQFFAFSTMKEKDQVKTNSLVFEYLGAVSFFSVSLICAFSYLLFKILFRADYYSGYIVAPYLFFAPLLQMLFQIAGNQFLVIKKTWPNLFILSSGAVLNIMLNFLLIPRIGIEGAAIATLMGYVLSVIICIAVLSRMHLFVITRRLILCVLMLVAFFSVWRLFLSERFWLSFALSIILGFAYVLLYRQELSTIFGAARNKLAK